MSSCKPGYPVKQQIKVKKISWVWIDGILGEVSVFMHIFYIIQFTFKKIKKRSEGVWFAVDTCAV